MKSTKYTWGGRENGSAARGYLVVGLDDRVEEVLEVVVRLGVACEGAALLLRATANCHP